MSEPVIPANAGIRGRSAGVLGLTPAIPRGYLMTTEGSRP